MDIKDKKFGNPREEIDNITKIRGRPKKKTSAKKVRQTITLDPGAWERICENARMLGYKNGSTFLNDIGSKLNVSLNNQDLDNYEISVAKRLLSCGEPPTPRLWSAFSFARSISLVLGCSNNLYDNESLIEDAIRRAMTALYLRSFFEPDNYICNITGYTNWIAWHILQNKAGIPEASVEFTLPNELDLPQSSKISEHVWRIVNAIELLRINYPREYQIFRLHLMERLTGKQIRRILRLRDQDITEEDALKGVKKVINVFRQAWLDDKSKEMPDENTKERWMRNTGDVLKVAQRYLELIQYGNLREDIAARKEMEQILLVSINIPLIDTFIREIDHAYGHYISNDSNKYKTYQEQLRQNLYEGSNKFSKYFPERLEALKKSLRFFGNTRQEIYSKFMTFIEEEIGCKLPEKYFLNLKNYIYERPLPPNQQPSDVQNKESVKEVINSFYHYLMRGQAISKISSKKLNTTDAKEIFRCIESGDKVMCVYSGDN